MSVEFKQSIKETFDRYKRKSSHDPLIELPVHDNDGKLVAFLKPITKDYLLLDPDLPELLGRWRAENPTISTGKFQITKERTMRWLDNLVVGREDRLVFLVEALDGTLVGHLGYSDFNFETRTGLVDSVLRGVKSAYPGLMSYAVNTIVRWGINELKLQHISLSVFSDGKAAIQFYERLGFHCTYLQPLYEVNFGDEVKLEIAPEGYTGPVARYYQYMDFDFRKTPGEKHES